MCRLKGESMPVWDPLLKAMHRRRAFRIWAISLPIAAALTGVAFLF